MVKLFLATLALSTAMLFMQPVRPAAHGGQEDAAPLGANDVSAVVEALEALGEEATDGGWRAGDAASGSLIAAIYAYAADFNRLGALPVATERVLVTYEALTSGVVSDQGVYSDGADTLVWYELLHLPDVPLVSGERAAFDGLRKAFLGEVK